MTMSVRYCSICTSTRVFEPVPCPDGHGGDCPELLCVECGYVVVIGLVADPEAAPAQERSVA